VAKPTLGPPDVLLGVQAFVLADGLVQGGPGLLVLASLGQHGGQILQRGDAWCTAQIWLGRMALYSADPSGTLGHFTAVRDAVRDGEPSLALADGLAGRSAALANLGRFAEALAALHLRAGRAQDAAHYLRESLQIAGHTGDPADVFNGLDWCGYLCAATDRAAEAVTVWAARAALSRQHRNTRPPALARRRDEPLARARRALGEARAQAAEDRGAAMSLATAAEYALTLTAPVPRQPPPTSELARLSPRERELVTLIARGRTDAQIAAHLFISIRTVASHLDRIRAKTGCRRRADLTRLALTAGLD